MECPCQSGRRSLSIQFSRLTDESRLLRDRSFGGSWEWAPARDEVQVNLGPGETWTSLATLMDFFHAALSEAEVNGAIAAWVPGCSGGPDACEPPAYRPLNELAPKFDSPLMDILQNKRIETWFQPIFRADSLDIWGYECLMRGRDAQGGLVMPGDMLKWARQENLIFMLDRICRELHIENAGRANLPPDTAVLINFLPTAIYDPKFCLRTTEAAARRVKLESRRIIFEVVETDLVTDREHLCSILTHYRDAGFRVALDDVGAGYSGLMMLAELEPDLIKIDRSLIEKAVESKPCRAICSALISIGRDGGKLVLAEGVETRQQAELMRHLGVDLFQGFYFARPHAEPLLQSPMAATALGLL